MSGSRIRNGLRVIPPLLLLLAWQRPAPAAPRAHGPSHAYGGGATIGSQAPQGSFDSTVAAIRRVARQVAVLRSALEQFRRAVPGSPAGVVVERGEAMGAQCGELANAARDASGKVCAGCTAQERQAALNAYRAHLPALARIGRQCAAHLGRLTADRSPDRAAEALRRDARAVADRLVAGLVTYEQRLLAVRRAFGWTTGPDRSTAPASFPRQP